MKTRVANEPLADLLDRHTVLAAPELVYAEGDRLRCVACGHRCLIGDGLRGICKVRFNDGGQLKVPFGYVAGVQCDPVEKKPFFHVYPGSDALTFGMLGCDLHCSYCFPGDTLVLTDRGPLSLEEAFRSAARTVRTPDAEMALPDSLRAVVASGGFRPVRAVFKHAYRGRLTVLRPYYLPELRCTPDHRVYATSDPAVVPQPIKAGELTDQHFLAIPRGSALASARATGALQEFPARMVETSQNYLIPLREVSSVEYDGDVYNMEVEEEHNFLAGFFLVSNCQNWLTSQALRDENAVAPLRPVTPTQLIDLARRERARLVVSSYNEPLITAEWAVSVFREATAAGLACAFVSNGNATPEVLDFLRPWIVAYKIDLKGFTEAGYRSLGGTLESITRSIRMVHKRGLWLEVVTLIVPGFNDGDDELRRAADFLASVSPDIPWHVTAFHKDYKMTGPDATRPETLVRAAEIGTAAGLRFVYAGNLPGKVGPWENTRCPSCRTTVIERYGFLVRSYHLTADGRCPACQARLPGIWPDSAAEVRTGNDQLAYQGRQPRGLPLAAVQVDRTRGRVPLASVAADFAEPPPPQEGTPTMPTAQRELTAEQRRQVFAWAAARLGGVVTGRSAGDVDLGELRERPVAGAFISLKRGKHLRSCCGLLGQPVPLLQALERATVRAAREDERFPPLSPLELDHLELEVWLLHNLQPVAATGADRAGAITLGKHGIQVVRDGMSGLFLPSVAVDHAWEAPRYLDQVCLKAGLPPTAWRDDRTALFTFEGESIRGSCATAGTDTAPLRRWRPEDVQAYAQFCRDNLAALLTGRLPSYYLPGAADANVCGVVLTLARPDRDPLHCSQLSLRHGLPLQATLFTLTQAAAQQLAAERPTAQTVADLRAGVSLLSDPMLHGTVGDPHLAGLDPRHRAVLVLERNKTALVYDPHRTPDELLTDAAEQARVTDPLTAAVYSLDAATNLEQFAVSTAPKPVRGPAVRPAAVAGMFYDGDGAELCRTVDRLLQSALVVPAETQPWAAAMVPHAGLKFSGRIAADVLRRIEIPRTVLVLGPKHTQLGMDWAVTPQQAWALPGGGVESDFMLARHLCQAIPGLEMDAAAHQREHAIEVELPLLARLAPEARVVGIAIGAGRLEDCRRFAAGLAELLRQRKDRPLLLISSDMNHFADDAETRRLDEFALAALDRGDPAELHETVTRHNISMCGVLPAVIVLETLRLLGRFRRAERVGYATTADVTGDTSRVVGYAGMLFG